MFCRQSWTQFRMPILQRFQCNSRHGATFLALHSKTAAPIRMCLLESVLNGLIGRKFISRRGAVINTRRARPTAMAVPFVEINHFFRWHRCNFYENTLHYCIIIYTSSVCSFWWYIWNFARINQSHVAAFSGASVCSNIRHKKSTSIKSV